MRRRKLFADVFLVTLLLYASVLSALCSVNYTVTDHRNETTNLTTETSEWTLGDDEFLATASYSEVFLPPADESLTNSTRCSHTQLSFTKETLLHLWEINGLHGYLRYIARFDQPFEVKTEDVSFKSENVDGKWTFKVLKARQSNPSKGIGDIRLVATYSYEARQPRSMDFIVAPTILQGSKEIRLDPQKNSSPTIIQQKFYNTRGQPLNSHFLEYLYTFSWLNVMERLNSIQNESSQTDERNELSSEEFLEHVSEAEDLHNVTFKFVIQVYFPNEPRSVSSSHCNSNILDKVITSPTLYDNLKVTSLGRLGKQQKDRKHVTRAVPPYFRYTNSMIYDERFTDVILVLGEEGEEEEEHEVPAHRIILATSSPVFSALLENMTLSQTQNETTCQKVPRIRVEPRETSLACLEQFLRYIYTGSVSTHHMNHGSLASQLILLADRYGFPELKRLCESAMLRDLNIQNAMETYMIGKRVSSERLTQRALSVMKMNKGKLAAQKDQFRELSMQHPTLMYELFLSD